MKLYRFKGLARVTRWESEQKYCLTFAGGAIAGRGPKGCRTARPGQRGRRESVCETWMFYRVRMKKG